MELVKYQGQENNEILGKFKKEKYLENEFLYTNHNINYILEEETIKAEIKKVTERLASYLENNNTTTSSLSVQQILADKYNLQKVPTVKEVKMVTETGRLNGNLVNLPELQYISKENKYLNFLKGLKFKEPILKKTINNLRYMKELKQLDSTMKEMSIISINLILDNQDMKLLNQVYNYLNNIEVKYDLYKISETLTTSYFNLMFYVPTRTKEVVTSYLTTKRSIESIFENYKQEEPQKTVFEYTEYDKNYNQVNQYYLTNLNITEGE